MADLINPYDGYRVFAVTTGQGDEIYLSLRLGGHLVSEPVKIWGILAADKPACEPERTLYALSALCRYLNSGGNWDYLMDAISDTRSSMRQMVEQFTLEFPSDLECIGLTAEDSFQMFFHNTVEDTYLVVTEDCYCEEMSGVDLLGSFQY